MLDDALCCHSARFDRRERISETTLDLLVRRPILQSSEERIIVQRNVDRGLRNDALAE